MPKRKLSNLLALAILSLLHEKPMHPYEIGVKMRQRGLNDTIKLNTGSLYAVIDSLLKHRLIQPVATEREGKHPERTIYEPTADGVAALFDWLRALLQTPSKEYPQFAAGLAFLAHLPPLEAADLLEARSRALVGQIAKLRKATNDVLALGVDRLFLIEQDYSITLLEAEAAWVERLLHDIRHGSLTEARDDATVWKMTYVEENEDSSG